MMKDDDETRRYRVEFSSTGSGVGKFEITTPGVRVVLEYTEPREMVTVASNLDAILFDAARAADRGDVNILPMEEWDPKPEDFQ